MNEEKERQQAEPAAQKQLGYDPNVALKQRLDKLECDAGEALLAIKVALSAEGGGIRVGMSVKVIGPDNEKVNSLIGGFLTMAAVSAADAIRDTIRPALKKEVVGPAINDAEKTFASIVGRKPDGADAKPEEVPHGV